MAAIPERDRADFDDIIGAALAKLGIVGALKRPLLSSIPILKVMAAPPVITAAVAASSTIDRSSVVTGSIAGNVFTVATLTSGQVCVGDTVSGGGTLPNTTILRQLPGGTPNGVGTYQVNYSQTVAAVTSTSQVRVANDANAVPSAWKITAPNPGPSTASTPYIVPRKADNSDNSGQFIVFETKVSSPIVEFAMVATNSQFDIFVDGELIQPGVFSSGSSGSPYRVRLDWGADANPWKERHYRIAGINMRFGGCNVPTVGSVKYPNDRANRRLLVAFGDSYVAAVGSPSAARTPLAIVAEQLGMDYYGAGIGSLGWNTTGSNLAATRAANEIATMNRPIDVLLSAYGYNDAGGDMTTLAANYSAWVAAVRAGASVTSSTRIRTLGPWTPKGITANLTAVKNALFAQAAIDGVPTVDISSIITLANSYVNTGADNVHPSAYPGSEFLGTEIGPRVAATL